MKKNIKGVPILSRTPLSQSIDFIDFLGGKYFTLSVIKRTLSVQIKKGE